MKRRQVDPLDAALDALASIWANAQACGDTWTMQRAAGVLRENRERLHPQRNTAPEWREIVGVPGQSPGQPEGISPAPLPTKRS